MSLRLIEPATALAVTLAEAKVQARITDSVEDALITTMIHDATAVIEHETGRAMMEQVWELTLDSFDAIVLTRPPVISVNRITYVDTDGVTQVLSPTAYRLRNSNDFGFATVEPAYGAEWPATLDDVDTVKVTYTAGYEDGVPVALKRWIVVFVSTMLENREGEVYSSRAVSTTVKMQYVDGLLDRYRVPHT